MNFTQVVFGFNVKFWHADNGIFDEKAFRDEIKVSNQTINFCVMGAHYHNDIIKLHQCFGSWLQVLASSCSALLIRRKYNFIMAVFLERLRKEEK